MNARPRPMAETHKLALLDWLRTRHAYGQGAPSDRAIATRLGLRSTDDALALVQALAADGAVSIETEGNYRYLILADPPAPAGARPFTADMIAAAKTAVPLPPPEPAPVRGRPAPVSIRPTRPLFASLPIDPAPVAAPASAPAAPPPPEDIVMAATPRPAERQQIKINTTANEHALIRQRADAEGKSIGGWARDAVRAQLLETSPAQTPVAAAGKPRLSARVIRIAHADKRGFWPAISMMIELGATALAAQDASR